MKAILIIPMVALLLTGCGTAMTKQAAHVQVHRQYSSLLDDCTKLGPIQAKTGGLDKMTARGLVELAENNLRHTAAVDYGADTVVILNTDYHETAWTLDVVVHGVALDCYK